MHPRIEYPGELASIVADVVSPMDLTLLRDMDRLPRSGVEASLAQGYCLEAPAEASCLVQEWEQFMAGAMGVNQAPGGFEIHLKIAALEDVPQQAWEAYRIVTREDGCEVSARQVDGLRRGLYRLEDEMRLRRAPYLPIGSETRWASVRTRISRSPIAPYRWLSGWELEDENDYYPHAYLQKLARCGVNGIWVAGLLRNLVPSRVIPELGPPQHRLEKLRALVERAAQYGIRVYFFCIEPRALPLRHPAASADPEIIGSRSDLWAMLCPSSPRVRAYLRDAMATLFREAPGLGGVINIFCGERPTCCGWDEAALTQCPRCSANGRARTLAYVLNSMVDGVTSVDQNAEMLAWTYTITRDRKTASMKPMQETMALCDPGIIWLANFEHGGEKAVCGKPHLIHEYALSYIGPAEPFSHFARSTRAAGRHVYAKLQLGTSCEMASVPYLPVPGIVRDKLSAMQASGVTGSLLTWTFGAGGYPGCMLKAAGEAAFAPVPERGAFLQRLAAIEWGEVNAVVVANAWERFGQAWQHYPFDLAVLYWGPVTRAPAYHLHLEHESRSSRLYNFGLERTREPQWWGDDVERWCGSLTPEDIIAAFRKVAQEWSVGVELLEGVCRSGELPVALRRQAGLAKAIELQLLSSANVYEFYWLRDQLKEAQETARPEIVRRLRSVAKAEINVCQALVPLMEVDPYLGFFTELYARVYSISMVQEKIRQVERMIGTLNQWEQSGVDDCVLTRTVAEADRQRPDAWGD